VPGSRLRFFVLGGAAYVGLRLAAYLPSSIGVWPDTGTYLKTANDPLLSADFLAGWRPLTVPLLYKVLPDSDSARAIAQLVISIMCWLSLAAAVAWNVRRPGLREVAFGLVLLFSLSVWITQWDRVILSDSLSLSLAAASLAAWLALVRAPSLWTVAAVLVAMGFLAFTRDSESSMALMAAPFALAWAVVGGRRKEGAMLTAGLLAIVAAAWAAQSSDAAEPRRQIPILNVIGVRVLPSPDERRWFLDHGMPLPDEVAAFAGTPLATGPEEPPLQPGKPLREEPEIADFLRWVSDEGRQTLVSYLIAHPYRAIRPLVDDVDILLATDGRWGDGNAPISVYQADGTDPLLPGPLADVVYPPSVAAVVAWLGLLALAAAWLARLGRARPSWLVPAGALVLQIPHALVVWHGEPLDMPRHALSTGVLTRASLLILTIFVVEAALTRWRSSSRHRPTPRPESGAAPASSTSRASRSSARATGGRSSHGAQRP
jgi:hypothetical protein